MRPPSLALCLLLLGLLASACQGNGAEPSPTAKAARTPTPAATETPTVTATATPQPLEPQRTVYVADANFAVDLEFAPDGRLFYNELRTGRIRIVTAGSLQDEPFAVLPVVNLASYSEHGLLGLTLDPGFESNHYVYAFHSLPDGSGNPLKQRVVRFREVNGQGTEMTIILDDLPVGPNCCHNGGRLAFGPDGKLYVSLGDAENRELAQDVSALNGKILRINADGSMPADNPIPGSPVWAWGLGNPFGLAFAPDGSLYATENGPQGFDEVNRIVAGGNYGWPTVMGPAGDPRFIEPLYSAPELRVAPTGITVYTGDELPDLNGKVLFCRFNPPGTMFIGTPAGDSLTVEETDQPCSLDVTTGPDGALYFSDANSIYRWGR